MQNHETLQLDIERLLVEFNCCVNDLQGFWPQLSVDDARQVEINLQQLQGLISYDSNPSGHLKLIC